CSQPHALPVDVPAAARSWFAAGEPGRVVREGLVFLRCEEFCNAGVGGLAVGKHGKRWTQTATWARGITCLIDPHPVAVGDHPLPKGEGFSCGSAVVGSNLTQVAEHKSATDRCTSSKIP